MSWKRNVRYNFFVWLFGYAAWRYVWAFWGFSINGNSRLGAKSIFRILRKLGQWRNNTNDTKLTPNLRWHIMSLGYSRKLLSCTMVKKLLVVLPTSCLVGCGLTAVIQFLSKQRNQLQITDCGDLRFLLNDFKQGTWKLVSLQQAH